MIFHQFFAPSSCLEASLLSPIWFLSLLSQSCCLSLFKVRIYPFWARNISNFRRYLSLSEGVLLPDIGAQRSPRSARKLGGRGARLVIYSENRLMCVSGLSGLALLVVQGSDRPDSFLMDDKWYLLQNTIYKSREAGCVTYARRSIYQLFIWFYYQSYPLRNFWQGRCRFRLPNTILKTLPLCVALAIIDIRYKKCLLGLLPCRKSGVQSTEKGFLAF